jgi:phosphoglycerate kinase
MKFRTLDDLKLNGKRVLLRVDLNSDLIDGKITESDKIKEHAKTIKELLYKKARVVIIAHQGNPGKDKCTSLKKNAEFLKKYVKVKFIDETIGKKSWASISALKNGEALLLENVRFLSDEYKPSTNNAFVNFMEEVGFDYYINDAFSVCHRNQTSIVSFPKIFPHAIGRVMEAELKNIEKLKLKNCLFILGGSKTSDLIPLLKKRKILTTGKLSLLCLIARGFNLGKENELLKKDFSLLKKIKKNLSHIKTPNDLAINFNSKRKELSIEEFPQKYAVWDIGERTINEYKNEIKKAKVIFFKGSPGMFEYKEFEKGTREILKAISNSKAFSVIAGGQSSDAIKKFKIPKNKFSYISLSGGALVSYLAGEKLPGLEALSHPRKS